MSQPTTIGAALPPEYSADPASVKETLPPDTLRFAGRFIHSATSVNAESGLYEINCQIDFLRETDRKVEFSRIDYKLNRRGAGAAAADSTTTSAPEIVAYPKHAFNIERPPLVLQEPFAYYLRPVSRSGLGLIGIRFAKVGKSLCKAWHVRRKAGSVSEYEMRELLFDARMNNKVVDWLDGSGARLAVEEARDGMYSLNILTPLDRAQRDALVATWCVRRWEMKAVEFHQKRTWRDRKHIMETCTQGLPGRGEGLAR
ncbi:hypothetical protein CkaCkLH20_03568 [Colletotrichum karsti]|uniref:Uncharacterized protein n=1 Tax=Colletotrichum karsti TaxID=1095194 RepID=A0A9P6LMC1_9PEZI|nr:uncharacterized protein CkaCkLH20_03568 [Colletotrichum karsti]KAF9878668.1 hypothetical protein CkaCkLH20_03568 [Colletotrichum karsti]